MQQHYAGMRKAPPTSRPGSVLKLPPSRKQSTRVAEESECTDFDPQAPPKEHMLRKYSNRTDSTASTSTGYSAGVPEPHSRVNSFSSLPSSSSRSVTRWVAKEVLRVVHSAPLVFEDDNERIQPVAELDLSAERKGLKSALEDTGVDVMFDFCTIGRLGKFLSQGRGKVLHYSGHGHAEQEANGEWGRQYLAIEDGWGKMHKLPVQALADWIEAGGNNLQLVFVSACHSRTAGDAFCRAGVKHVVCCKDDGLKIRNDIATEFTKGFYQSLANGRTISQAFDAGRNTAKNCSHVDQVIAHGEVEKIVLLPEDKKHDVKIFHPDEIPSDLPREYTPEEMQLLGESQGGRLSNRKPPPLFEGRQLDMYNVLSALRARKSIVRITGPKGVGKCSVVAGVCQYIQARKHIFKDEIDFLDWLDIDSESGEVDFSNQRFEHFHEAQSIIIVDARKMKNGEQLGYVEQSLRDIISSTYARAIVIERFDRPGKTKPFPGLLETEVHIEPLGFDPTLLLFARQCKFVGKDAAVKSVKDFRASVVPDDADQNDLDTKIGRQFYGRMGGGFPLQIQARARAVASKKEFKELIQLGQTHKMIQAWKQELQLHTRTDLDKLYMELLKKKESARTSKEYAHTERWKIKLEELDLMKEKLPDISSLQQEANQVQAALDRADDEGDYAKADKLKFKLVDLTVKIQNENMAARNPRRLRRHTSQFGLKARIESLEAAYKDALAEDDIARAANIQKDLHREKRMLDSKPTIERRSKITAVRLAEYKAAKKYAENNVLDCNLERLEELHQKYLTAYDKEAEETEAQFPEHASMESEGGMAGSGGFYLDGSKIHPAPPEASGACFNASPLSSWKPSTTSSPHFLNKTTKSPLPSSNFGSRNQPFKSRRAYKSGFGTPFDLGAIPGLCGSRRDDSLIEKKPINLEGQPPRVTVRRGDSTEEVMLTHADIHFKLDSEEVARQVQIGNVPIPSYSAPHVGKKRAKRLPCKQNVDTWYPGSTCESLGRKREWSHSNCAASDRVSRREEDPPNESNKTKNDELETHETNGRTVTGEVFPRRLVAIAHLGTGQRKPSLWPKPPDDAEGATGEATPSVSPSTASSENDNRFTPFFFGADRRPTKGRLTQATFPVKRRHRKPTSDRPRRSAKGCALESGGRTTGNRRAQSCVWGLPPNVPSGRRSRSPPLSPQLKNRQIAADQCDLERETPATHLPTAHQDDLGAQPFHRPPLRRQDPPGNYGQSHQRGGGVYQLSSTNNSDATSDMDTSATPSVLVQPLQIPLQTGGGDLGKKQDTGLLDYALLPFRVSDRSCQEVSRGSEEFGSEETADKAVHDLGGVFLSQPQERVMLQLKQSGSVVSVDEKSLGSRTVVTITPLEPTTPNKKAQPPISVAPSIEAAPRSSDAPIAAPDNKWPGECLLLLDTPGPSEPPFSLDKRRGAVVSINEKSLGSRRVVTITPLKPTTPNRKAQPPISVAPSIEPVPRSSDTPVAAPDNHWQDECLLLLDTPGASEQPFSLDMRRNRPRPVSAPERRAQSRSSPGESLVSEDEVSRSSPGASLVSEGEVPRISPGASLASEGEVSSISPGAYRVGDGGLSISSPASLVSVGGFLQRTPEQFTWMPVAAEVEPAVVVMAEIVPERRGLKAILGLFRRLLCLGKKE